MPVNPEPLMPHNLDAERATLSCILVDPSVLFRVRPILQPAHFFDDRHRLIYEAMCACDPAPADLLIVQDALDRTGRLAKAGGEAYLAALLGVMPVPVYAEHYAKLVADSATRRDLIGIAGQIAAQAYVEPADEALAGAHKLLLDVSASGHGGGLVPVSQIASELYDRVEAWANNPLEYGQTRGLATGIPSLDHLVGGLYPGWLVMVAARPGVGKSALCFEVARRVGRRGESVAVFSLEMPKLDVLARWASAESQVETRKLRRGVCPAKYLGTSNADFYITDDELGRYTVALSSLAAMDNVFIDDTASLSCAEIRARAMRLAQKRGGLDLVVVDHTTIIKSDAVGNESTAKIEGRKSDMLRALAKELACPVMLVQQLNRGAEGRTVKEPSLADLRDSGEHEQNAHVVLGLYRESYYKPNFLNDTDLEILALKNREGPSGMKVKVRYERNLSRFTEYEKGNSR